jgi:hypothetical protein
MRGANQQTRWTQDKDVLFILIQCSYQWSKNKGPGVVHCQTSRRISHIATTGAHLNKEDLMGLPLAKMWARVNWFEVETAWATPERLVVTPLRDDGNPSRQQSLE